MEKIDFKKKYKTLYQPSARAVVEVDVPAFAFLMIDGMGDPGSSPEYGAAVEALFSLAYTLKFMIKKSALAIDYGVLPLEGLWWADDMNAFVDNRRDQWRWTMMIMQPDFITAAMMDDAMATVRKKKGLSLDGLRLESFAEGRCAQILHIGPFSEEGPTIEKVHRFIEESGHQRRGKHHEIYLSDIRRAAPEKWKTVIRQPLQ
ncbi:MAG: GyrI-like domain-containing protein [Candidatus Thiodiazotropha sp.]|jgi:hypothetical protein